MTLSALITMLLAQGSITAATLYFFKIVLKNPIAKDEATDKPPLD